MTIGTPLWDDFVKNLKKVKLTVEDMGFMPEYVPSESDYESMSGVKRAMTESMFHDYYCCYAKMSTEIVHNHMIVVVDKVNEVVRNLYYNNFVNLDLILNMVNLTGITLSNSRPWTAIFHIIPKFYQRKALFLLWSTFSHNFFVILQQHLPISASMSFE